MTTNNTANELHATAPCTLFEIISSQQDAEEWANLLEDFLGPETDVYTPLLKLSERQLRKSEFSS